MFGRRVRANECCGRYCNADFRITLGIGRHQGSLILLTHLTGIEPPAGAIELRLGWCGYSENVRCRPVWGYPAKKGPEHMFGEADTKCIVFATACEEDVLVSFWVYGW